MAQAVNLCYGQRKYAQQGWFEVDVRKEDVTAPDVIALLQDHLKSMTMHSPPESIHALNADRLRQPDVTFWSARGNGILLGCGAISGSAWKPVLWRLFSPPDACMKKPGFNIVIRLHIIKRTRTACL